MSPKEEIPVFQYGQSAVPRSPTERFQARMSSLVHDMSQRRLINRRGTLTDSERRELLDVHNLLRSESALGLTPGLGGDNMPAAADMNALFWDPCLERVASNFVADCVFAHNGARGDEAMACRGIAKFPVGNSPWLGENVYAHSSEADDVSDLYSGIFMWYDESHNYGFDEYCSSDTCSGTCGHFTAAAWAETRYVGCGYAYCPDSWTLIFLCDYYPGGNMCGLGNNVWTPGSPATGCDADRTPNYTSGLCAGGMNSNFANDQSPIVDDCDDGTGRNVCSGSPSAGPAAGPVAVPTTRPTLLFTTSTTTSIPIIDSRSPRMIRGMTAGEYFRFEVRSNRDVSAIGVVISGDNGDADLYVRWDAEPTTAGADYDCASTSGSSVEECFVEVPGSPMPRPHVLHVAIYTFSPYTALSYTWTRYGFANSAANAEAGEEIVGIVENVAVAAEVEKPNHNPQPQSTGKTAMVTATTVMQFLAFLSIALSGLVYMCKTCGVCCFAEHSKAAATHKAPTYAAVAQLTSATEEETAADSSASVVQSLYP